MLVGSEDGARVLPIAKLVEQAGAGELAPAYWQQIPDNPDVQRRLGANVYLRILLADPAELARPATAAACRDPVTH